MRFFKKQNEQEFTNGTDCVLVTGVVAKNNGKNYVLNIP